MAIHPAEIEGPVSAIVASGADARLTVMGATVVATASTVISSPSASLSLAELLDPAPLPGRTEPGFVGGTVIAIGEVDAASGVIEAEEIAIEPSENIILGAVTETSATTLRINGVPIVFLDDPRMPAEPPQNGFGFEIELDSVAVDTPASAEGYFDGSAFRAFLFEVDGDATLADPNPQVSILRADVRDRGDEFEVDARGAVTMAHAPAGTTTQQVRISRIDGGSETPIGTVTAQVDAEFPGFARWRFDDRIPVGSGPVLGSPPTRLRATNLSPGANNAQEDIDAELID
ncbi:hypothetical protein AB1L88_02040 [Tautonia sp. JC769]|uniref:hypothetical protein n=1 Tax=Tautonia sp. JC769 TaxID=3232135 RepID=UPI0034598827